MHCHGSSSSPQHGSARASYRASVFPLLLASLLCMLVCCALIPHRASAIYVSGRGFEMDAELAVPTMRVMRTLRLGAADMDVEQVLRTLADTTRALREEIDTLKRTTAGGNSTAGATPDQQLVAQVTRLQADVRALNATVQVQAAQLASLQTANATLAARLLSVEHLTLGSSALVTRVLALQAANTSLTLRVGAAEATLIQQSALIGTAQTGVNTLQLQSLAANSSIAQQGALIARLLDAPALRNRLLNGDFALDSHARGQLQLPPTGAIVVDRWRWYTLVGMAAAVSVQQMTLASALAASAPAPPAGFGSYLALTCVRAQPTVTGSEYMQLVQEVSGDGVAELAWGTAQAQSATLSFYVYSNVTGVFSGGIRAKVAIDVSFVFSYSITAPRVWQRVVISVPAPSTGSFTPARSGDRAFDLVFTLMIGSNYTAAAGSWIAGNAFAVPGSTNLAAQFGNLWLLTGVQLERSDTVTPFERRPPALESALLQPTWPLPTQFRNRILNGAFAIDQVNSNAPVIGSIPAVTFADRWLLGGSASVSAFTAQRNIGGVTPPAGFSSYGGVMCTTQRVTIASTDWAVFGQGIERQHMDDLLWGTPAAKPVTLSFYAYASVAGLYSVALRNSVLQHTIISSFQLHTGAQWQWMSITVPGPTAGSWSAGTPIGTMALWVSFALFAGSAYDQPANSNVWAANTISVAAVGQTNVAAQVGQLFLVTGVQLEVGENPSPFDMRSYGEELMMLQPYDTYDTIAATAASVSSHTAQIASLGFSSASFKNRLDNGDFRVDQLNAGAIVSPLESTLPITDRWWFSSPQAGKFSGQRSGAAAPAMSFGNSAHYTITTIATHTPTSTDFACFMQFLERSSTEDFNWNDPAQARDVSLSFYVYATIAGTYSGALRNTVFTVSRVFNYTVTAASTWQRVTLSIPAYRGGATIPFNAASVDSTDRGLNVLFTLYTGDDSIYAVNATGANQWRAGNFIAQSGQVNLASVLGASWGISNVQLELGAQATAFEFRPLAIETLLCQRYLMVYGGPGPVDGVISSQVAQMSANRIMFTMPRFPVPMRVSPTLTVVGSPIVNVNGVVNSGWTVTATSNEQGAMVDMTKTAHGLTAGSILSLQTNTMTIQSAIVFRAELI